MSRGTQALISASALRHNYSQVKRYAPKAFVWAVVKANAYGHDASLVCPVLDDADGFAVSTLDEAKALRDIHIDQPIILLEGVTEVAHLQDAATLNLDCVVHCFEQIKQLTEIKLVSGLNVWLKIDSGMHRLGFLPDQVVEAVDKLRQIPSVELIGQMTHLACADSREQDATTQLQVDSFSEASETGLLTSIANSAGIVSNPVWHGDWVRPGIMLYGATPLVSKSADELGLKPVMRFESPVIGLHPVKQGGKVGYGHRWQAPRDSLIATLAVGYGDGYPRHAPDGTPVWLNGQIVPLAGRVSMDMIMVDVTNLGSVQVGDMAELWGEHLPVDRVAESIKTIGYELLTRISPRVHKKLME